MLLYVDLCSVHFDRSLVFIPTDTSVNVLVLPYQLLLFVKNAINKIELLEARTEAQIAKNEVKIAHQFLLYGYAEEFTRFQKIAGVYKDGESSMQVDEKSVQLKADKMVSRLSKLM
jgi:hypothetical protein